MRREIFYKLSKSGQVYYYINNFSILSKHPSTFLVINNFVHFYFKWYFSFALLELPFSLHKSISLYVFYLSVVRNHLKANKPLILINTKSNKAISGKMFINYFRLKLRNLIRATDLPTAFARSPLELQRYGIYGMINELIFHD